MTQAQLLRDAKGWRVLGAHQVLHRRFSRGSKVKEQLGVRCCGRRQMTPNGKPALSSRELLAILELQMKREPFENTHTQVVTSRSNDGSYTARPLGLPLPWLWTLPNAGGKS